MLRRMAAEAFRLAMAMSGMGWKDLGDQGLPEQTARRVKRGENISLDTLDKALAAAGYRIVSMRMVDGAGEPVTITISPHA